MPFNVTHCCALAWMCRSLWWDFFLHRCIVLIAPTIHNAIQIIHCTAVRTAQWSQRWTFTSPWWNPAFNSHCELYESLVLGKASGQKCLTRNHILTLEPCVYEIKTHLVIQYCDSFTHKTCKLCLPAGTCFWLLYPWTISVTFVCHFHVQIHFLCYHRHGDVCNISFIGFEHYCVTEMGVLHKQNAVVFSAIYRDVHNVKSYRSFCSMSGTCFCRSTKIILRNSWRSCNSTVRWKRFKCCSSYTSKLICHQSSSPV